MIPKKSQSIIDFVLAFIAIAGLIVGIVRIWVWFNANYAKRQQAYQASRITAAKPGATYETPVDIGAEPLDLTEDWVFRGIPSGTISGVPVGPPPTGPGSVCDNQCTTQCLNELGCQEPGAEFNRMCDCYQACSLQCYCNSQIQPLINAYAQQVESICGPDMDCDQNYSNCDSGQACNLRQNAQSMREQAKKCDEPWEICWWGNWGKTPRELRRAARELDKNAKYLEDSAKGLNNKSQQLQDCCNETSPGLQIQCLGQVKVEAACEEKCIKEAQDILSQCEQNCGLNPFCLALCQVQQVQADAHYNSCYDLCINKESIPCKERVDNIVASIQSQIDNLKENKDALEVLLFEINAVLSSCATITGLVCAHCGANQKCYNDCYDQLRNDCCRICCQGSSWGRDCDTPAANCDDECTSGCPRKCGLSKLASNVNTKIQNITTQITHLEQVILDLPSCCNFQTVQDQNICIENKLSQ